jgi:hypothetical protein
MFVPFVIDLQSVISVLLAINGHWWAEVMFGGSLDP